MLATGNGTGQKVDEIRYAGSDGMWAIAAPRSSNTEDYGYMGGGFFGFWLGAAP